LMHTYKYDKNKLADCYSVEAEQGLWKNAVKMDALFGSWDEKNDYHLEEWRQYCKSHMDKWGYDEKSKHHQYEVRAQYESAWTTFKFQRRADAVAELKRLLSNNICAVLVEV